MCELAISGGKPVRLKFLPYGRQCITEDDIKAVVRVLQSDWLTTGPAVAEFEGAFASSLGAKHAIAVSSGTAALHAATVVVPIGPGDQVIVPVMSFAASANCVRYAGADVVFADVRPDTLNIDAAVLKPLVTSRTRAIIAVDYAGQPADLAELKAFADQYQLALIEDGCHALGATYRGRHVGAIADCTTFSLHPLKHITSGEGGVITTDNDATASRLKVFRNHGISTDHRQREAAGSWYYEMIELGFNYRLTDFQCALATSQLGSLRTWIERRRSIAAAYNVAFADMSQLQIPSVLPDREPAWHLYVVRLNLDRLAVGREEVFRALRAENIGVNVHYIPIHWHPYYRRLGYRKGQFPIAEREYKRMLSLPIWPGMSDDDVNDVIEAVKKVVSAFSK